MLRLATIKGVVVEALLRSLRVKNMVNSLPMLLLVASIVEVYRKVNIRLGAVRA